MGENKAMVKTKVLANTLDAEMFVQGCYATRLSCKADCMLQGKVVKNEFTG